MLSKLGREEVRRRRRRGKRKNGGDQRVKERQKHNHRSGLGIEGVLAFLGWMDGWI